MLPVHTLEAKQAVIQTAISRLIDRRLLRYETAELRFEDGSWSAWRDLPIRFYTDNGEVVSVSWSKFDDLWIEPDRSLPFSIEGSTVRWVENTLPALNQALGQRICSVSLGTDNRAIADRRFATWTRLLLELESGWLEVFNAFDENGYEFYATRPEGRFERCI
ncbi:MAG: hypothetical protein OHK0037_03890 [Elainellaceae cyanobacterium]